MEIDFREIVFKEYDFDLLILDLLYEIESEDLDIGLFIDDEL